LSFFFTDEETLCPVYVLRESLICIDADKLLARLHLVHRCNAECKSHGPGFKGDHSTAPHYLKNKFYRKH